MTSLPELPWVDRAIRREQALRLRILGGEWEDDLRRAIDAHFPASRADQQVPVNARNLAKTLVSQLAQLYRQAPAVSCEGAPDEALERMTDAMAEAGVWAQGKRLQRDVLFVREGWRCVERMGDHLVWRRPVTSNVVAIGDPKRPGRPIAVAEAVRRTWVPRGETRPQTGWVWQVYDLRGPSFSVRDPRSYKAEAGWESAEDITALVLEDVPAQGFVGEAYPWRYASGEPFIPYVLYHAEETGRVYDAMEGMEVRDATMVVAVLWSFWLHVVYDASWSQRATVNAHLAGGAETVDGGPSPYQTVAADPASIMQFISEAGLPAALHQWNSGVDPERLEVAVASFERATAATFGLAGDDIQRTGGAASGYSLTVRRGALREAQREYIPQFQRADRELLAKSAALANQGSPIYGAALPDDPAAWSVRYVALPASQEERDAGRQKVEAYAKVGVKPSTIWTVQAIEQVSREDAVALVEQWAEDEDELQGVEAREALDAAAALLRDHPDEAEALMQSALARMQPRG